MPGHILRIEKRDGLDSGKLRGRTARKIFTSTVRYSGHLFYGMSAYSEGLKHALDSSRQIRFRIGARV